jgi:hypothetical protein
LAKVNVVRLRGSLWWLGAIEIRDHIENTWGIVGTEVIIVRVVVESVDENNGKLQNPSLLKW